MGFLHKLWDETLAGPTPDAGLGKLRKYDSFNARSPPSNPEGVSITRSITIVRRNNNQPYVHGSSQESSSLPSTPGTPFSPGTPPGYFKGSSGRKSSVAAAHNADEPIKKSDCFDWVMMSALDR